MRKMDKDRQIGQAATMRILESCNHLGSRERTALRIVGQKLKREPSWSLGS